MSLNRMKLSPVAALLGVTLALTGCGLSGGNGDGGDNGQSTDNSSVAEGEIKGEITFSTLQLQPTFTDYINGVIADFEKEYPGTSVRWVDIPFEGAQERISTDASAGTMPDVINLNPNFAQPLEAEGLFVNLDQAVPDLRDTYVPGAWDAFQVPGKEGSYGFPWYLTSEVTMYNKAIFEQAGLPTDEPPATFEELFKTARTIHDATDGKVYGMHPALENRFMRELVMQGVDVISDDGKWQFNTPEAVEYLETLTSLWKDGVFPPDSLVQAHTQETEAYQSGQIALFPSGPNFLTVIGENAPEIAKNTGVGPQILGKSKSAAMSVMGLLVPESSKNKATALKFAEFMTNTKNQVEFSKIVTIFPSTLEGLKDPYFTDDSDGTVDSQARKISAEQLENAVNVLPVQFDDRVKAVVIGKVQMAMQGELSAKDALDQAVEEANAITNG